jgi:hypothetical protein
MCCGSALLVLAASASLLGQANIPEAPPQPVAEQPVRPSLDLPGVTDNDWSSKYIAQAKFRDRAPVFSSADRTWSADGEPPGISIGPLRAQFGGLSGKRVQLANFRLNHSAAFGADIAASVDSRSARVLFSWPTGQ